MLQLPGFLFTRVLKLTLTSCHLCLFLSEACRRLMIRVIAGVTNALIKRIFCGNAGREERALETSGLKCGEDGVQREKSLGRG